MFKFDVCLGDLATPHVSENTKYDHQGNSKAIRKYADGNVCITEKNAKRLITRQKDRYTDTVYEYDAVGLLEKEIIDRLDGSEKEVIKYHRGIRIYETFDELGRVASSKYSNTVKVFEYHGDTTNIKKITDMSSYDFEHGSFSKNATETEHYDEKGRLIKSCVIGIHTKAYEYHGDTNIVSVEYTNEDPMYYKFKAVYYDTDSNEYKSEQYECNSVSVFMKINDITRMVCSSSELYTSLYMYNDDGYEINHETYKHEQMPLYFSKMFEKCKTLCIEE